MEALRQVEEWPARTVAVAVVRRGSVVASRGDATRVFRWASVSKPVLALAVLVAAEEGVLDLDAPAGPPGATIRHLLAHTSGLPFEGETPIARPGRRRVYSNAGFVALADALAAAAGMPWQEYLRAAVLEPLGMGSEVVEGAGSALHGSLDDLLRFAQELFEPTLVAAETLAEATSVQFPGLAGVIPGIGRYDPNDWGLGFEVKGAKEPHWSGRRTSPGTYGHFGGSGTFLWLDPAAGVALACLTDLEFGDWALDAWPRLSDAVLTETERSA